MTSRLQRYAGHFLKVVVASLATWGCSTVQQPSFPSQGGPAWHAFETPHFTVKTDLERAEAEEVCAELESLYALLSTVISGGQNEALHTTAIVFRSRDELQEVTQQGVSVAGFMREEGPLDRVPEPVIVLAEKLGSQTRVVLAHELTHRIMHRALGPMPTWLDEGLAEYYSTVREGEGEAVLGESSPVRGFILSTHWRREQADGIDRVLVPVARATPPSALLRMDAVEFYERSTVAKNFNEKREAARRVAANYASAWAFVHLLMNGGGDLSRRFARALEEAASEDVADSLGRAFDGISDERLDATFADYLNRSETIYFRTPFVAPRLVAPKVRVLDEEEIALTWLGVVRGEDWEAYLKRARGVAPNSPEVRVRVAMLLHGKRRFAESRTMFVELLREYPQDPLVLMGYAGLLDNKRAAWPAETKAELIPLMTRLSKAAKTYLQLNWTAWYWATHGEPKRALPLARRACDLEPSCWECFDTYARAFFELRQYEQAVRYQTMAVARMPEFIHDRMQQKVHHSLRKYKKALEQN